MAGIRPFSSNSGVKLVLTSISFDGGIEFLPEITVIIKQLFVGAGDVNDGSGATAEDILVDVGVSEIDINLVEVGQTSIVTFDGILGKEYHGKVVEVSPVGSVNQGVVDFKVTVELTDADADVRPGMTAEVEILVDQRDEALLTPNQAVRSSKNMRILHVVDKDENL